MNRDERDQLITDATALEFTLQAAGQDDEARIVGSLAIELRRLVDGIDEIKNICMNSSLAHPHIDLILSKARKLLEGDDGKDDGAAAGKSPDIPSSFWDDPFA